MGYLALLSNRENFDSQHLCFRQNFNSQFHSEIFVFFPYYLKSEIPAKLKVRHVQVRIFYAKQNRIPRWREY